MAKCTTCESNLSITDIEALPEGDQRCYACREEPEHYARELQARIDEAHRKVQLMVEYRQRLIRKRTRLIRSMGE